MWPLNIAICCILFTVKINYTDVLLFRTINNIQDGVTQKFADIEASFVVQDQMVQQLRKDLVTATKEIKELKENNNKTTQTKLPLELSVSKTFI